MSLDQRAVTSERTMNNINKVKTTANWNREKIPGRIKKLFVCCTTTAETTTVSMQEYIKDYIICMCLLS